MIQFKIMFQELYANHLNWDDRLSGELLVKWKKMLSEFQQDEPYTFQDATSRILRGHHHRTPYMDLMMLHNEPMLP